MNVRFCCEALDLNDSTVMVQSLKGCDANSTVDDMTARKQLVDGLRVISDYLPTRESGEKVVCPLSNSK